MKLDQAAKLTIATVLGSYALIIATTALLTPPGEARPKVATVAGFDATREIKRFNRIFKPKDSVEIVFQLLPDHYNGVCFADRTPTNGIGKGRVIVLSTLVWTQLTDVEKEMLVFHELGHCVLRLPHRENHLPDGCPASLMYPSMASAYRAKSVGMKPSSECYEKHRRYYWEEMHTMRNDR